MSDGRSLAGDIETKAVVTVFAILGAILLVVAFASVGLPVLVALALAGAIAGIVAVRAFPRIAAGHGLSGEWRARRLACVLWLVLGCVAIVQTTRLASFTLDPKRTSASAMPWSPFMTMHSCATAYFEGNRLASEHELNVYATENYRPKGVPRSIEGFRVDSYEYPPPFLILPRIVASLTGGFLRFRALWFAIEAALLVSSLLVLGWFTGGRCGARIALWSPLLWISMPIQITLQIGNFQIGAIALSILGAVAFMRRRHAIGGALVAFATLAKLFPAFLLLYFGARREWRAFAWTAGWIVVLTAASWAWFGSAPFVAFLDYQLPRLSSGEAFAFLKALPWAAAINDSVYGVVIRLHYLGVPGASFRSASAVAWIYTLVLSWIVVRVARRERTPEELAGDWLAVIALAALRSPFLPQEYALVPPLLTLLVLAARWDDWTPRSKTVFAVLAIVLNINVPFELTKSFGIVVLLATIPQIATLVVLVLALRARAGVAAAGSSRGNALVSLP